MTLSNSAAIAQNIRAAYALDMKSINRVIEIQGNQEVVAKAIGVTQGAVSQWALGNIGIDIGYYEPLSKLSNGELNPSDFLADEIERRKAKKKQRKAS